MQEKVCIVLNERESSKAKVAEGLSSRLKELGITSSRVSVDENIVKILLQKKPRVLILDYLLGDYSTGLDVLSAFHKFEPSARPRVIFLTDEPSVPVAVEAMRGGALNYIEIDHPQALSQTVREVLKILESLPAARVPEPKKQLKLDDLVVHSKISHQLVSRARVLLKSCAPIILVQGPCGSGRTTLLSALHAERSPYSQLASIDLRFYEQAEEYEDSAIRRALRPNCSLLIKNIEDDDGTVLNEIAGLASQVWPNAHAKQANSYLYITSSDQALSAAWTKRLGAELLQLSSLKQRQDEIALLVQRFVREAQELSELRIKPFDASICEWLAALDWPGETRQLRNCCLHAAIDVALNETDLKESIEQQRSCWEQEQNYQAQALDPYNAAVTLESTNYSYRIAAARLGCSVRALREGLR